MKSDDTIAYHSLPLIIEPSAQQDYKDFITLFSQYHGALLFRGFGLQSISDFESFVEAFFAGSQPQSNIGATSIRHRVMEECHSRDRGKS